MRTSHTTKTKKAKCLNYRSGRRCGRVARHEVVYLGNGWHHLSVCDECLAELQEKYDVTVQASSPEGLFVSSGRMGLRLYRSIQ